MIRRPPSSTLFPSPPLSRSEVHRRLPRGVGPADDVDLLALTGEGLGHGRAVVDARARQPFHPRHVEHPPLQDRKSTRLNSSHANISYAVFCLKKKKNKEYHS